MNWQSRANGISLGMLFFVTQDAILAARFLRQIKTRTKMSRFMTRKMLLIHATEVSARLARILLSRYPYFPWPNFPSIGMRSRYSCRRCAFRRLISSLFSGIAHPVSAIKPVSHYRGTVADNKKWSALNSAADTGEFGSASH